MPLILPVNGVSPQFGNDCYIAPNATIVGQVITGDQCSFWFNAVVRGDVNTIQLGNKVNVQDGACIHCTYEKTVTYFQKNFFCLLVGLFREVEEAWVTNR